MGAFLRAEAQIDDRLFSESRGLLKYVIHSIHDRGRRERGLHHADVRFGSHPHVGERGLAVARIAPVTRRDPHHVRSMSVRVDLGRNQGVDVGGQPLRAVAESRGGSARRRLVPDRDDARAAVRLLKIGVGVVDPRVHVTDEHPRACLPRERRRRHRADRVDPHVERAVVEIRLAPFRDAHAIEPRSIEERREEGQRHPRGHAISDARIDLDAPAPQKLRGNVPLQNDVNDDVAPRIA